jgi:hypothetical protein
MSDQAWALNALFKYRLQVDFSRRTIECRGYNHYWCWDDIDIDFYQALHSAIKDIEKY